MHWLIQMTAILASWPFGIQREREYGSSFEFKLKGKEVHLSSRLRLTHSLTFARLGNPWSGQGSEAIPSRVLMMAILRALYNIGHVIYLSTDLSRKQFDKDSIFFRWHSVPPPPCTWFAISFNMGGTIRVIEVSNLSECFRKPSRYKSGSRLHRISYLNFDSCSVFVSSARRHVHTTLREFAIFNPNFTDQSMQRIQASWLSFPRNWNRDCRDSIAVPQDLGSISPE